MTRLGDLCEFRYGKSLPEQLRCAGAIPVYGSNGVVGYHNEGITDGQAIVIGRKGSIGAVHLTAATCWPIDTTYYVDRSATEVDLTWLGRAMSSLHLARLNKAAAVPGLNRSDAYDQKLFVPRFGEQRRIAAILDKADALRRKRKRALDLLDSLTQSIFLEMFGTKAVLDIQHKPLTMLTSEIYRYPTYFGIEYVEKGVPEIRGELICEDGSLIQDHSKLRFISADTSEKFPKTILQAGDLVMSVRGTIGKIGQVPNSLNGANITANLIRISPDRRFVEADFLKHIMRLDSTLSSLKRISSSTTIATIKASDLRALELPCPSLKAQRQFCSVVRQQQALRSSASQDAVQADALFASLQSRAFAGRL